MTLRVGLLACLLTASSVFAGQFSFQGTFTSDDQVQLFNFTVSQDSIVTFQTFGFGGGTNAAGATIAPGGFDPLLSWYYADGTQVGSHDDDGCPPANTRNVACGDVGRDAPLGPGSYILALTVSGNLPNGDLSDGFSQQGNPGFTLTNDNTGSCTTLFCDTSGNASNGNWAVDIITVDSASQVGIEETPEPASFGLLAIGLSFFAPVLRRRGQR